LSGDIHIKTALHTVCLTGAALLAVGACLLAGSEPNRSKQGNDAPTRDPIVVAMQESQAAPQDGAQRYASAIPSYFAGSRGGYSFGTVTPAQNAPWEGGPPAKFQMTKYGTWN
jgi:hypothetical protein